MHQVEVEVVQAQVAERLVERWLYLIELVATRTQDVRISTSQEANGSRGVNELIIPQLGCNPNTGSIQPHGLQAMLDALAHLFLIAIDCSAV